MELELYIGVMTSLIIITLKIWLLKFVLIWFVNLERRGLTINNIEIERRTFDDLGTSGYIKDWGSRMRTWVKRNSKKAVTKPSRSDWSDLLDGQQQILNSDLSRVIEDEGIWKKEDVNNSSVSFPQTPRIRQQVKSTTTATNTTKERVYIQSLRGHLDWVIEKGILKLFGAIAFMESTERGIISTTTLLWSSIGNGLKRRLLELLLVVFQYLSFWGLGFFKRGKNRLCWVGVFDLGQVLKSRINSEEEFALIYYYVKEK